MSNPEGLFLVVPLAWGLYKCSILARHPTTNRKAIYALAVMLGVWLVGVIIAVTSSGSQGDMQLLVAGAILFTGAPIVAIVLALLGLREIRLGKRTTGEQPQTSYLQGTWQAVGALLLAGALLVPFAVSAGAHFIRRRAQRATAVASPNWTAFTSPQGDFEVQFPSVPEETATNPAASDGGVTARIISATHGRAMYAVTMREDPAVNVLGAEAAFDAWEKSVADRFPGRVADRNSHASGGVATREVRGVSPATATAYRFRAVVADRHWYVLAAIMPETTDQAQIADRFFQSFTLREAGTTRPGGR